MCLPRWVIELGKHQYEAGLRQPVPARPTSKTVDGSPNAPPRPPPSPVTWPPEPHGCGTRCSSGPWSRAPSTQYRGDGLASLNHSAVTAEHYLADVVRIRGAVYRRGDHVLPCTRARIVPVKGCRKPGAPLRRLHVQQPVSSCQGEHEVNDVDAADQPSFHPAMFAGFWCSMGLNSAMRLDRTRFQSCAGRTLNGR
jgi:hypothetical protein